MTVKNPLPYIILDTCVIQAASSKNHHKSEAALQYLKRFNNSSQLAISEISVFENLQGLWGKRADKALQKLKQFEWKEVNGTVLILASQLGGLYNQSGSGLANIQTGDKLIAATAILLQGFVLTINPRDFPAPFFYQQEWEPLTYQNSHYSQTLDLYVLAPNFALINRVITDKDSK